MKKFFKIFGITIGSLVCLVVLVVLVASYVVFTPKRLTPVVNRVADSLLTCPHVLDEANITFVRTFPDLGLSVKGLYIINPMEGAQSDTVLAVPELVVSLDAKKILDGDVDIKRFNLHDVEGNIYISEDGRTNVNVLNLSPDTIEEDTTAGWQLKSIRMRSSAIVHALHLSFVDRRDSMEAMMDDMDIRLAEIPNDTMLGYRLDMEAGNVNFIMKDEQMADNLTLSLTLPILTDSLNTDRLIINGTRLAINGFAMSLDGEAGTKDLSSGRYDMDVVLKTDEWHYSSLMAILPDRFTHFLPDGTEVDGDVQLTAHAYGVYSEDSMPTVDAELWVRNAQGHYDKKVLPYEFSHLEADIRAHADLNTKSKTTATIQRLYAKTGKTYMTVVGDVQNILKDGNGYEVDDLLLDVRADVNIDLPDADYWLKDENSQTSLQGQMTGTLAVKSKLSDVTNFNLNKMKVEGDLMVKGLDMIFKDSTLATADEVTLKLTAPKAGVKDKAILSANCEVGVDNLHAQLLASAIDANVKGGKLKGAVEIDTKDTMNIPTISAGFDLTDLVADMDTIHAHVVHPIGNVAMTGSRRNKAVPRLHVDFTSDKMEANMGQDLAATTDKITIVADARYDKNAENILLKWNPKLQFNLKNGEAEIARLGTPVIIPMIKFNYSNRDFIIDTSRVVLGHSDFSLGGEVKNLGKWIKEDGELVGNLRFISDRTDVNELLDILNRFNASPEQEAPSQQIGEMSTTVMGYGEGIQLETSSTSSLVKEKNPFMVPDRVDLTLVTHIKEADIFDEHLRNMGGRIYVKDGVAVLEEIGFICEAAKLQLTALYKTPRKDHIYVGLDYHMVDIDLQKLISMIPQLDTLVPMLGSFKGGAQFHIAAETYVNSKYEIKPSTLRGACAVEGKDLVLLDNETFRKISKLLMFSHKTENVIDSLSVQITAYKDEITVYPFCLSIDNYMAAVGGNHFLDMTFNYHASLLKPFYIGVDIGGTFDDLDIKVGKCRYAQDFRPIIHKDVETQSAALRKMISNSLKKNVKIQSDNP